MNVFSRLSAFFLSVITALAFLPRQTKTQRVNDFRVTAYIAGNQITDMKNLDKTHLDDVTDIILIGVANFDVNGELYYGTDFEKKVADLRDAVGDRPVNLYLNLIGPGSTVNSSDWNEQMDSQGKRHDMAFRSGNLEKNVKDALDTYGFDGVFFDYEYPLTKEHWEVFDEFIIGLDKYLGDDYKIGCAISAWMTLQSRKAIRCLDMVEAMAYDVWDKDGTHASMKSMKSVVNQLLLRGYKREQIDIGIPFYGRPTDQGAYWYGYNGWYDKLDEKGLCVDPDTGLTFSFNTPELVAKKTEWAIRQGYGGIMVWHYACDVPADNSASLFNAAYNTKTEMMQNDLLF